MERVSVCELSTLRWSFYEDAVRYSINGINSIGVWRPKLSDFGEHQAIELLHKLQLKVSSVHWAGAFTGCDGKSHLDAIEDAIEAIHLANQLESDCLIVHSGSQNGHTNSHAVRLLDRALDAIVPIANDYGVRLAIEPMPGIVGKGWTFVDSIKRANELISKFSSSDVGIVLDLYHFGFCSQTFEELDQFADRIALVQLADRRDPTSQSELRCPLGSGTIAIDRWLERLGEVGYSGAFEVELHGQGMSQLDYFEMIDQTADYLASNPIKPLLALPPQSGQSKPERSFESVRINRPSSES